MSRSSGRILLGLGAALLGAGAVLHGIAFRAAAAAVQQSNLPPFYANSLKALWLGDSSTMLVVGVMLAWLAMRPTAASRPVVILLSVLVAGTAATVYVFLGAFLPGHILAIAATAVFAGSWGTAA